METISIRMDKEGYLGIKQIAEENKEDVSKAIRELVERGKISFAVEKYKNKEISLGKAAELAGVSISKMIDVLADIGIKSHLEYEDYARGLENLRKEW
jgi:predicted HTH domain antitoxin